MILYPAIKKLPWVASLILMSVLAVWLSACDSQPEQSAVQLQGKTMGTTWHVTIVDEIEQAQTKTLQAGIAEVLKTVNDQMSTWQADSELSQFNASQETDWFAASPELVKVITAAQEVSALSGGVYDITVGPLVNLWGFGASSEERVTPPADEVEAALARVGYEKLEIKQRPTALRKTQADLYVDLSSIAKGFGVDQVALYLEEQDLNHYMVEIGGEVRTQGQSPRGDAWRIAIEKPVDIGRSVQQGVRLQGAGLATSGDYRNFFSEDGQRYSHTIDPNTGYPVKHSLASVSVVADTAMLADAYATMLLALGDEKGRELADKQQLKAYFIMRTDEGFETYATSGFKPLLLE